MAIGQMLIALFAQLHPFQFQNFLHTRQAHSGHHVVQCFPGPCLTAAARACPCSAFLSSLPLTLLLAPTSYPTRSFDGRDCRHSNLNNAQHIARFCSNHRAPVCGTESARSFVCFPLSPGLVRLMLSRSGLSGTTKAKLRQQNMRANHQHPDRKDQRDPPPIGDHHQQHQGTSIA